MTDVADQKVPGLDLRLARVRLDVKAGDIAAQMGVTSSRVAHIEHARFVSAAMAAKYRAALAACSTVATPANPPEAA